MLKITEIKMYKDKALKRFVGIFTGFKSPKIVVVPASKRQAVRCKVLRELSIGIIILLCYLGLVLAKINGRIVWKLNL